MKKLTVEEVKKALREYSSAEPENDEKIVYYLHIKNGKPQGDMYGQDEQFTAWRWMDDYFENVGKDREDWGAMCAEVEDAEDGKFDDVCEELTRQANAWIEEQED